MDNLTFFDLERIEREKIQQAKLADLPDVVVIAEGDPRRIECTSWPNDYSWHMPVHECEPLMAARAKFREIDPECTRVTPVVYCAPKYTMVGEISRSWIEYMGWHKPTDGKCPYCGANLADGEGAVIMERRCKNRSYCASFERRWGEEAHI